MLYLRVRVRASSLCACEWIVQVCESILGQVYLAAWAFIVLIFSLIFGIGSTLVVVMIFGVVAIKSKHEKHSECQMCVWVWVGAFTPEPH